MSDLDIMESTKEFAELIKTTDTYREYDVKRESLKAHPELFEKALEFRRESFALQNSGQEGDLLERTEAFRKKWEKFRENPLVEEFLVAELAFCRMMQEINVFLTTELDFE